MSRLTRRIWLFRTKARQLYRTFPYSTGSPMSHTMSRVSDSSPRISPSISHLHHRGGISQVKIDASGL